MRISGTNLKVPKSRSRPDTENPAIAGWQTLHELETAGTVRRRYLVRRLSDELEAVLTIYSPGATGFGRV